MPGWKLLPSRTSTTLKKSNLYNSTIHGIFYLNKDLDVLGFVCRDRGWNSGPVNLRSGIFSRAPEGHSFVGLSGERWYRKVCFVVQGAQAAVFA